MITFAFGLLIGLALGLIVIGFLAIGAYDRGRDDVGRRRRALIRVA